jgi:HlyD family secretion protein
MNKPLLMRRLGIAAMVVAAVAAIVFVAQKSGPLAATEVTVSRVGEGQVQPSIFGIGTVEARRGWMVGPTAAGRVLSVRADVGQMVNAGDVLAEMDSVDMDERVKALDASIARADSLRSASQAAVDDAAARRALAAINAKRNQDLAAQNFISAGALESRLQEQASAEAQHQSAVANHAGAGQELQRLKSERTALTQQRGNLRLLAPAKGMVISRDAEAGSTVLAGQAVLRLVDPSSLWIRMRVDQGRSAGLAAGLAAQIVLRSQPGLTLKGLVARVEPVADSVTEERVAQVTFDTPSGSEGSVASIGELAEVVLALPATEKTLVISNASIQRSQGQTSVWRLANGKIELTPVRLGASSLDGKVQVLEGLSAGDSIVVYSQKALTSSSRIRVVESLTGARAGVGKP